MTDAFELAERAVRQAATKAYGKYRGIVTAVQDTQKKGVIRVQVPSILGDTEVDAEPCFPYGGSDGVGLIAIPAVGAGVFVEFVEGDISAPIWVGAWTRGSLPADAGTPPDIKLWRSAAGHMIAMDDTDGQPKLTITSGKGGQPGQGQPNATITMGHEGGVAIADAVGNQVTLDASAQSVTLKDAAGNSVTLSATGVEVKDAASNSVSLASSGVTVKGTTVKVEASMVTIGQGAAEALIKGTSFLAAFNAHTHVATAMSAPTGPPVPPLTPAVLTTATSAA
ncbi:MAG: phage baseplate assembly protein V [Pseudomonadota bacterium]